MRTLIYIDPDPANRLLVRKVLEPAGFNVLDTKNAASAQRIAARTPAELVLVDVDVVGMSADLVVRTFRQSPGMESAVLVATTAEDRPDQVQRTAACGFSAVLTKPLDPDTLLRALAPSMPEARVEVVAPAPPVARPDTQFADIQSRWRRTLFPLTEQLLANVSVADALLALFDSSGSALILVAASSVRTSGEPPAIGARIPLTSVQWVNAALDSREPGLVDVEKISPSPLIPAGRTSALVVPVATDSKLYGVIVLGERRRQTFAFPPTQIAESVREAGRIAAVLSEFDRLDGSVAQKRREIEDYRVKVTHDLATAVGRGQSDPDRGTLIRLGLRLAQRLNLSAEESELLRQALEVHDIGRAWIETAVLPHMNLPAADRQAVLSAHAEQTDEILRALAWPQPVVDLVRMHHRYMNPRGLADGDVPLAARIMAVTTAYDDLVHSNDPNTKATLARDPLGALASDATRPLDQRVMEALADQLKEDAS